MNGEPTNLRGGPTNHTNDTNAEWVDGLLDVWEGLGLALALGLGSTSAPCPGVQSRCGFFHELPVFIRVIRVIRGPPFKFVDPFPIGVGVNLCVLSRSSKQTRIFPRTPRLHSCDSCDSWATLQIRGPFPDWGWSEPLRLVPEFKAAADSPTNSPSSFV